MRLSIRTVTRLAIHLPGGRREATADFDLPDGATLADLLSLVGLPETRNYLVTLNGATVPKAARAGARLHDGDALVILPIPKTG